MSKYTITPWRVALPDETRVTSDAAGHDVAQVLGDYDVEFERMAADARMLAAAPDFYNAACQIRGLLDYLGQGVEIKPGDRYALAVAAARFTAAIAKAEGRP